MSILSSSLQRDETCFTRALFSYRRIDRQRASSSKTSPKCCHLAIELHRRVSYLISQLQHLIITRTCTRGLVTVDAVAEAVALGTNQATVATKQQ